MIMLCPQILAHGSLTRLIRAGDVAAAVHRRPHRAHRLGEADEQRLPDHVVADIELDDLGQARDRLGGDVVEAVAGMDFEPGRARQRWRLRRCAAIPHPPSPHGRRPRRRTRRRYGFRSPARAASPPFRSGAGSAAMNSDTRMPASFSRAMNGASALCCPTTSRPPSVVSSSRRSGTRHTACGFVASAIRSMSSVAAISKFSGFEISAFSRAMSSSRMWRRSSRKCAVMPSAPASIATSAARTGSGLRPARALRRVAT